MALATREKSFWKKCGELVREWFFLDPEVWFSWLIVLFYGGFLVAGVAVLGMRLLIERPCVLPMRVSHSPACSARAGSCAVPIH